MNTKHSLEYNINAQRHNFNGPQCGPKPHESRTVHFEPEVKRAGQGIVILQAGTNKYATQKGMVMGGVRHIADIRCDQYDAESNKDVCLQSGSNKFASQKGMSFGAVRHGNDIKSEEITDEGKRTINLQYGYTAGANQSGMSFGKNRSIVDYIPEPMFYKYYSVNRNYNSENIIQAIICGEAQRHNFNGPQCGPKPHESRELNFDPEVMRAGEGIIGLQAGSNKFATQKGMVMGGVRHVNDIKSEEVSEKGKYTINLQYGFNHGANQAGMNFGKKRSIVDI
ncbi:protein unc-87-like [Octopus sinensis]|uniref:Protein unc-87-like n=1 Tax=Octopus sinensis TaxID=2607531 RepID=A0A6P7TAA0_9MOLL|nr:protein unc-87-like [Octopus sinensis]